MSSDFTKPSDRSYDAYQAWQAQLTEPQQEWISHKCRWEHMGRWAVALEWGAPVDPEKYL